MAEKRKFAALAELHRDQGEATPSTATDEPVAASAPQETGKGRGRPATGKRSNPDWKLYSHYLKRRTQHEAAARLLSENAGRDLSDVLQELLEKWLKT